MALVHAQFINAGFYFSVATTKTVAKIATVLV